MLKFVSPAGWDFGQPATSVIKYGSRGLIGNDRRDFLKTAAAAFEPMLSSVKIASDEVPIHLIALGAQEYWGANRNGDGFKVAACRRDHPTFVKYAKWFRNHRNKLERNDPFYGCIKAAAYNDEMHRVELIVALNREKSAAERNGGFIADRELEKLARGDDIPVSMAANVPYDVCSFCGNKARTRDDYCTAEKCAAGGCSANLAKLVKVAGDMHHLHVDNEYAKWFDISNVVRPADRTAYGAKADYLVKAACDGYAEDFDVRQYFKFAEDQTPPLDPFLLSDGTHAFLSEDKILALKVGYALASLEKNASIFDSDIRRTVTTPQFPVEKLANYGSARCTEQLAALADRLTILDLPSYARLSSRTHLVEDTLPLLPSIYTKMAEDDVLPRAVDSSQSALMDAVVSESSRRLADTLCRPFSFAKSAVENRVFLSCIRGQTPPDFISPGSSVNAEAIKLATDYATYKLAALYRASAFPDFFRTARYALAQNRLSCSASNSLSSHTGDR